MKPTAQHIVTLCFAVSVSAQSVPNLRFNGHVLGETAETFFSTARAVESKGMTKEYCKSLLNDAATMKNYEAARTAANKKDFLFSDVGGCQQVMAALRGERAQVGARLASELGKGRVSFAEGRVVSFTLTVDSSFSDVVAEMSKRFAVSGHRYTRERGGGPGITGMRWNVGAVTVLVFQLPYRDEADIYVGYAEEPSS